MKGSASRIYGTPSHGSFYAKQGLPTEMTIKSEWIVPRLFCGLLVLWATCLPIAAFSTAKRGDSIDNVSPKEFYLDQLIRGVAPAMKSFLEDTGRFVQGGWCVDNQEVIYPLAYLFTLQDGRNPYAGDKKLLNAALKGGDAICEAQYEDGTVEFLKNDGSNWGRIYLHQTLNAWLEAYVLLQEQIDQGRKSRWERGIHKMVEGVYQQILGNRNQRLYSGIFHDEDVTWGWGNFEVNHLSTWDGLNVYRAGQIFQHNEWQQTGQRMVHSALESLDPLGYWPEFGGPSTTYNLDYLQAVGLYYEHSGDLAAIPYLERALDFQIKTVYPEGCLIETFDGRSRYTPGILTAAHFTFSQLPEGRRFVKFLVSQMNNKGIALPLSSDLLRNLLYYHEGVDEKIPLEKSSYVYSLGNKMLVRRKAPWFYCLSGFTAAPTKNRWGLDRQNFVSVWNDQVGLIVSGGNSKAQPEWSNFVFPASGRPTYIPSNGTVREKNPRDAVILTYEDKRASIEVSPKSKKELQLKAHLENLGSSATGQLVLYLRAGSTFKTATGEVFSLSDKPVEVSAENSGGWIEYDGWRITLPHRSRVSFPSYPFAPQNRQAKAALSEARGLLFYPLDSTTPSATFTITVMKP